MQFDGVMAAIVEVIYLKEAIHWNHLLGFALIAAGAFFIFRGPG